MRRNLRQAQLRISLALAWPASPPIAWGIETEGCSVVFTRIAVSRLSRRSSGRSAAKATRWAQTAWGKIMGSVPEGILMWFR